MIYKEQNIMAQKQREISGGDTKVGEEVIYREARHPQVEQHSFWGEP